MATYVNDLRLKEIATGDESGSWGTSTNTNLELIGEALGYGTQDCFSSDADATTTVADGATDPARAMYFKVTSSATLSATRTLTIAPNTISRVMWIQNATTGSQSINISQGSGANVTIATGKTAVVYLDGAGSGAAVVDAMALVDPGVTDTLTEVLAAGNTTGGTDITFSAGDNITNASGDFTIDIAADINLDAGGDSILFKSGGTHFGDITKSSNDLYINAVISDGDIYIRGNDGGSTINAVQFDMSAAGAATFNDKIIATELDISGNIDVDGTTNLDVVDIDGAVDMASTLTLAGNADFNGDLDVDGTTNLDAVDIDGAVDMASTLTLADDLTVDSGTLFVDASANRVGVNTTAPAYELDVDSTIHVGNDGGSGFTHARTILDSNGAARGIGTFFHNQANDVEWFAGNPYNDTDSWSINRQATASHADSTSNVTNALMSVDSAGNVLIGGTSTPSSSAGNLALFNGTAPSGSVTNGIVLYAEDVSSSSELKVRDEAGNVTTLSPHNFELIPEGPSEDMAWSYFSEKDGKRINVDMLKAIRVLEKLSGEQLVFES